VETLRTVVEVLNGLMVVAEYGAVPVLPLLLPLQLP